jgi:hypothetical protein
MDLVIFYIETHILDVVMTGNVQYRSLYIHIIVFILQYHTFIFTLLYSFSN